MFEYKCSLIKAGSLTLFALCLESSSSFPSHLKTQHKMNNENSSSEHVCEEPCVISAYICEFTM